MVLPSRLLVALLTALSLAGAFIRPAYAASASGDIPLVAQSPTGAPGFLRVDDSFVVWSEQVQPNRFRREANLYAASFDSRLPLTLATGLSFAPYFGPLTPGFDVDGGVAVWVNQRLDDSAAQGLLAQDLRSGRRWTVTDAPAAFPAINGMRVVWWEDLGWGGSTPNRQARLMLRDLNAMDAPRVLASIPAPKDYLIRSVTLGAGWAAWLQGSYDQGESNWPCWRLWAVGLNGAPARQVADLGCGNNPQQFTIDLQGAELAYTQPDGMLVVHQLDFDRQTVSGPHSNRTQVWAGRFLFWGALADGQSWGYDPASDSAFPVEGVRMMGDIAASATMLAWFAEAAPSQMVVRFRPVAGLLPNTPRPAAAFAGSGRSFFAETGHSLGGAFRDFWQRNGGLPVFGYTLTEEFTQRMPGADQGYTVQYLERQRFEFHPENAGTPYQVLLGRLGAEALAAQGRDWQQFPKANPAAPYYYAATGQAIDPRFWAYWRANGLELGDSGVSEREALALWGYPISPPMQETLENGETYLVQWFERARFEYHPENPAPYQVLIGRLAAEQVDRLMWK